jgi:hypothetical protein
MSQSRRRLATLTSHELKRRAVEYSRMAMAARGQATVSALDKLAIRYALLATSREIEETSHLSDITGGGSDTGHAELAKLIASVKQVAVNEPNPAKALAQFIHVIAEGDADPYVVMGVLLEGAIHVIGTCVPLERQQETAGSLMHLVEERLRAAGLLDRTSG